MKTMKERIRKAEIRQAKNRYGLDMAYFHQWFERSLFHINDYKPAELARELARMSRTAESSVLMEKEFTGIDFAKACAEGTAMVKVEHVDGKIVFTEIPESEWRLTPTQGDDMKSEEKHKYIATSITTGGKQEFWLTDEQFSKVHITHPAWCNWRRV